MAPKPQLTYPSSLRFLTLDLVRGGSFSDANLAPSWHVTEYSEVLGHGEACYRAAAYRLFSWRAHWEAGVGVTQHNDGSHEIVNVHFGPTSSPCLILHRSQTARRAALVYGTLPGHVERGEEAFIVEMSESGEVTGRCLAFSQHAWWLAKLGAPVARGVQLAITRRYVRGMVPQSRQRD